MRSQSGDGNHPSRAPPRRPSLVPGGGGAGLSLAYLPLTEALARAPARYRGLLDFVEWKLIEMPLPRLQTIGDESVTFLYAIN